MKRNWKEQIMSTLQTIRESKAERLRNNPAPQNVVEVEEEESHIEWFKRLGRDIVEWRKRQGLPEESDITMEEVVAIVKEARAERYAEEQKQKNAANR